MMPRFVLVMSGFPGVDGEAGFPVGGVWGRGLAGGCWAFRPVAKGTVAKSPLAKSTATPANHSLLVILAPSFIGNRRSRQKAPPPPPPKPPPEKPPPPPPPLHPEP